MNITSSGAINNPVFPEDLSPELKEHLSATIDQWRFYPLMKQGKIVEQTIAIPLQLRQDQPQSRLFTPKERFPSPFFMPVWRSASAGSAASPLPEVAAGCRFQP
jgi:hypothetical protein